MAACYKISGPHEVWYAPFDSADDFPVTYYVGQTGEEGIRANRDVLVQDIVSDQLGGSIIDGVYQGANMEIEFVAQDVHRNIVQAMLHPWQTGAASEAGTAYTQGSNLYDGVGVQQEYLGGVGRLACGVLGTLELIPVANAPAATFQAGSAAANANGRQYKGIVVGPIVETLDASPRFVPIRFRVYPFFTAGGGAAPGTGWKLWNWINGHTAS